MANTIKISQGHKEVMLKNSLRLTPEQMVFMTTKEIDEYNNLLKK